MRSKDSRDAVSVRTWLAELLPVVVLVLILSALVEFFLLRILNRMGNMLPAWMTGDVMAGLVFIGNIGGNVALLTGVLAIIALAGVFWGKKMFLSIVMILWIPILVGVQIVGSGVSAAVILGVFMAAFMMGALIGIGIIAQIRRVRVGGSSPDLMHRLVQVSPIVLLIFVLFTYLGAFYLHIGDTLANLGWGPPNRADVYGAVEWFAVGAAFLAPVAFWRRFEAKNLILPTVGAMIITAFALARPDILPLASIWSIGFRLNLPLPLYIGALWCFLFSLVNLFAEEDRGGYLVPGLLLLFLSGRMLNDFYVIHLAVLSIVFLSLTDELKRSAPMSWPMPSAIRSLFSSRNPVGTEGKSTKPS